MLGRRRPGRSDRGAVGVERAGAGRPRGSRAGGAGEPPRLRLGGVERAGEALHRIAVGGELRGRHARTSRAQALRLGAHREIGGGQRLPAVAHRGKGEHLRGIRLVLDPARRDGVVRGRELRQRELLGGCRGRRQGGTGRSDSGASGAYRGGRGPRVALRGLQLATGGGDVCGRGTGCRALRLHPRQLGAGDPRGGAGGAQLLSCAAQLVLGRLIRDATCALGPLVAQAEPAEGAGTDHGRPDPPELGDRRPDERVHLLMLASMPESRPGVSRRAGRAPWRRHRRG